MSRRILSVTEQVAQCLREEILRGRWSNTLPGIHRLASQLDLPRKQVERALPLLEKEGLIVAQGPGRKRLIHLAGPTGQRPLRVAILDFDPLSKQEAFIASLTHRLSEKGHTVMLCEKTLEELGMNPMRIGRFVERVQADAWLLRAAHRPVLEWFIRHAVPVFSIYGNFINLPVSAIGLHYVPPLNEAIGQLVKLGHRRISILGSHGQANPTPDNIWGKLLAELTNHGLATGPGTVPKWQDDRESFNRMLAELVEHHAPTALIIEEVSHLTAAFQFCAHRGLRIPQDVSLICMQPSEQFAYCLLRPTHIDWDTQPVSRVIERWLRNIARGRTDTRQHMFTPALVAGETIGPAPRA